MTWRLGHRAELDGLRGIAILLVLACHGLVPWFEWAGGAVGVSVFFTLSGFLITSVLIADCSTTGRIHFRRFYAHRVRRLAPALIALMAVTLVLGAFMSGLYWQTFTATVGYCANWLNALHGPYAGDMLGHTWSLSIEEQFYLVWPLIFGLLARRSTKLMLWFGGAVCVGSLLERILMYNPELGDNWRIYFGTDTRSDGLMYGCLLAVLMSRMRTERSRPDVALLGLVGIAWCTALRAGPLSVFGPALVSLAVCATIFGSIRGAGFRPLTWTPLTWVGQRSYGIYLWHAPVMVIIHQTPAADRWYALFPALLVGSMFIAASSWRWIEEPFLSRSADPRDPAQEIKGSHPPIVGARIPGVVANVTRGE